MSRVCLWMNNYPLFYPHVGEYLHCTVYYYYDNNTIINLDLGVVLIFYLFKNISLLVSEP